ncbi:MAG: hypothetical protein M3Y87_35605 [Myxococcota bacterium]|nr:hypothetical protein [Myxococcota bacterium]
MGSPYRTSAAEAIELTHESAGVRYRYALSGTHLAVEWRSASGLGRTEHPLRELSADVEYFEGESAGDPVASERGVISLALAAVVYFSSFQEQIPLLAPFLVVAALFYGARVARASKRSEWSVIRLKDGRHVATIDHGVTDREKLALFLTALRERVGASRSAASIDAEPPAS